MPRQDASMHACMLGGHVPCMIPTVPLLHSLFEVVNSSIWYMNLPGKPCDCYATGMWTVICMAANPTGRLVHGALGQQVQN